MKQTQPLSACCKAVIYYNQTLPRCKKCKKFCDLATSPTSGESWEKQYKQLMVGYALKLPEELHKELTDFIRSTIRAEREKTEKAYGGCHKCYGKGYATYRHGLRYSADMPWDKEYVDPMETHMIYCTCDRGKQLKELVTAEKLKILEACKLEKKLVQPDYISEENDFNSGYNEAVADLNAIREKIKNNI